MNKALFNIGRNLRARPFATVGTLALLLLIGFILGVIIGNILHLGPITLILSIPFTLWISAKIPFSHWLWKNRTVPYWAKNSTSPRNKFPVTSDSTTEGDQFKATNEVQRNTDSELPVESGCLHPRETPRGTKLLQHSSDNAVMQVKSAVRFWSWFLPGSFVILAFFVGIPFGALMGYSTYNPSYSRWTLPVSNIFWGSAITFLLFLGMALWAYFETRPWVRIVASRDIINYGGRKFDRRYHRGMMIGYTTNDDAGLKNSFFDLSLGMAAVRLTYGPWGEDLPYLINKYHSEEIVIWMNQIIDSVGAPAAKQHDPYAGKKIELL